MTWTRCASPLFALILLLCACDQPQPFKIGFVAGQSGRVADLGVAGRNGAMLAVEEVNAAGGIQGRPVELLVRDDEQNPETARRVVGELHAQKVAAIVGPMTSGMAMAVVPLANAAKIPFVSPTVTTADLTGLDDYFLRIISSTAEYAAKSAHYQYHALGRRRIALIYDLGNRAYTESWVGHFRSTFGEYGGTITDVRTFTSAQDTTFLELCRALLQNRPETVMVVANSVDAALIAQQLRKLVPDIPLALAEWAATERLIELGGSAVEGALVDQYVDRNSQAPAYREFLKRYRERYGLEPGFAGVAGYDAAKVVLEGLRRTPKGGSLRATILATSLFPGLQQQIPIDRYGDASRPTYLSVIRAGRFVTVE